MSTLPLPERVMGNGYPTTDGKPMAETDYHRDLMGALIETLKVFYADEPMVYVSGNLLLFYEEGNRRKHVSPDVFVVPGVAMCQRPNYLLWEEGQPPRFLIELTSSSTRRADTGRKFELYRDVLKVREYFLFDPLEDYLTPSMQGWRLRGGVYHPIRAVAGRLPSLTTGLHLARDGTVLRLWNPQTRSWLPTPQERAEDAEQARDDAEQRATAETQARRQADAENARLRRLLERAGIPHEGD